MEVVTAREMEVSWPFGVALAGGGVKPPHAALAEDCRGERCGKGGVRAVRRGPGRRTRVNHR
jgi:hypothetical protein